VLDRLVLGGRGVLGDGVRDEDDELLNARSIVLFCEHMHHPFASKVIVLEKLRVWDWSWGLRVRAWFFFFF
jgi:hypothetical protein